MLKIAWNRSYVLPLPAGHRFPMLKYELLPEQLLFEGTIKEDNLFSPEVAVADSVLDTHTTEYWIKLNTLALSGREARRTGFPLTRELVDRETTIVNGTIACVDYALRWGIAMNIAGGTHHAFTDRGEGFCLLNDQAVAAIYFLRKHPGRKVLIIDLDVHQGNGTAQIFHDNPDVFTFSIHGVNNYPLIKEQSDLDIGLPDFTDDVHYLAVLDSALGKVFDQFAPDFIFYQSGVDVLASDKLGKLSLTREGCRQRDLLVMTLAQRNRIPIVVCMGGGYSPQLRDIVEAHANTFRLAQILYF